jgi:hypothetical protein
MGPAKAVEHIASNVKPKGRSAVVFKDKYSNQFKKILID